MCCMKSHVVIKGYVCAVDDIGQGFGQGFFVHEKCSFLYLIVAKRFVYNFVRALYSMIMRNIDNYNT